MKKMMLYLSAFILMNHFCFAESSKPALGGGFSLKACPESPNCVSSKASDPRHEIAPLVYSGTRDDAMNRLKKVLSGMKRIKIVEEKDNYLRVEATSFVFRFVDDVEFLFDEKGNVIDVRSASRVGYSDLGVNRKRVEEIRARFNAEKK